MTAKETELYVPLDDLVQYLSRERHLRSKDLPVLFRAADITFEEAQATGMLSEGDAYSLDLLAGMPYTIVDGDGIPRKRRYINIDEFSNGQFYFSSDQICSMGDLSPGRGKDVLDYAAKKELAKTVRVGEEMYFCLDGEFALDIVDNSNIFDAVDKLCFVAMTKTPSPGSFVRMKEISWQYIPVEDGAYLTTHQLQQLSGKSRKDVEKILAREKIPSKSLWGERWYKIDLGNIYFFPNVVFNDGVFTLSKTQKEVIAEQTVSLLESIVKKPLVEKDDPQKVIKVRESVSPRSKERGLKRDAFLTPALCDTRKTKSFCAEGQSPSCIKGTESHSSLHLNAGLSGPFNEIIDSVVDTIPDSRYLDKEAIGTLLGINPAAAYERAKNRNIPFRMDGRKKLYFVDDITLTELKKSKKIKKIQAEIPATVEAIYSAAQKEDVIKNSNDSEPLETIIAAAAVKENTAAVLQEADAVSEKRLSLTDLAQHYYHSHDPAIKETLVVRYQARIRKTAGKVLKEIKAIAKDFNPVPFEELVSSGNIGLLEALKKYNPAESNGAKFETFAFYRIRGSMIDYLRGEDILDRDSRKKVKILRNFAEKYWQEHHAEPDFVAYQQYWIDTGYKEEEFADFYAHSLFSHHVSLDSKINKQEKRTFMELLHEGYAKNNDPFFMEEVLACIKADLQTVPERYRRGIEYYLFEQSTQEEAGQKVGLSKSWFSRILEIYVKSPGRFQRTKDYLKGAEESPLDLLRKKNARLKSTSLRLPVKQLSSSGTEIPALNDVVSLEEKKTVSGIESIVDVPSSILPEKDIPSNKIQARAFNSSDYYFTKDGEMKTIPGDGSNGLNLTEGAFVGINSLQEIFGVGRQQIYTYIQRHHLTKKKQGSAAFYFIDNTIIAAINEWRRTPPKKEAVYKKIEKKKIMPEYSSPQEGTEKVLSVDALITQNELNNDPTNVDIADAHPQKRSRSSTGKKERKNHSVREDFDSLGYYFSKLGEVPLLSREEEVELGITIQAGRTAWLDIYSAHLPLVLEIIENSDRTAHTLTIDDLVKQGNIGLAKAIDSFDCHGSFVAYAQIKVQEELENAVRNWEDVLASDTPEDLLLPVTILYDASETAKQSSKSNVYYFDRAGKAILTPADGAAAIDLHQGVYLNTTHLCQLLDVKPSQLQYLLKKFPLPSRKHSSFRYYYLDVATEADLQQKVAAVMAKPLKKKAKREGTKFANKETEYDNYNSNICFNIPLSIDDVLLIHVPTHDLKRDGTPTEKNHLAYVKYQRTVAAFLPLSEAQKQELWPVINQGKEAVQKMCQANLRLVVSVAKRYPQNHLSMDDLIQEGNIGMMKAATKFDPDRGFKFSTYATWWIRQGMMRAIANKGPTVRRPVHLFETEKKIRWVQQKFLQQHGTEPTDGQIAELVNTDYIEHRHLTSNDVGRAKELVRQSEVYNTFDHPLPGSDDGTLGEFVKDNTAEAGIYGSLEYQEFYTMLTPFLTHLNDKEHYTLVHRLGLYHQNEETLEEIALKFGVTRERIRQIELKAFSKLRKKLNNDKRFNVFFKEYLDDFNKQ
ncbi:MAG: sigma-70 family RNA polymerase sigma factor [Nanoarchaeota archaeon]|nr:sigma-70 family RNA polymerase sigma factor [Nanoarchaeota archaeon]